MIRKVYNFPEYLINLVKNKNYAEDDSFNPLHAAGYPF